MNKYITILLLFFLLTPIGTFGQRTYTTTSKKAIKLYEEGKAQYRLKYMLEAEKLLLKAIEADKDFQEPYMVIAELYWDKKQYKDAISMYEKGIVIDPEFYPTAYSNKGELEFKVARYQDAKDSFKRYLDLNPKSKKGIKNAKRSIEQADFAIEAMKNPVSFEPIRLSDAINSVYDEYWPSLSADAKTMIFTRLIGNKGKGRVQEDFYISYLDSLNWTPSEDVGSPLNTPDNEGAQAISANGKFMVYTVCNRKGVIGRCDIYYSEKLGDTWTEPKNIGRPINTPHKETQPSLSSDGRTLYFSSDRPGGYGKQDIWVSKQDINGKWSEPVNLGDSINTSGYEASPFIHHDNNTLYFSSNYHLGMGGFDIFLSRRNKKGEWAKPQNIGYPINTSRDEVGLIINAKGSTAYYSSDIFEETGRDIYQFELYEEARPAEVSYLQGKVYNGRTRKALKASFELYDLSDGRLVAKSYSDYRNGEFLICLPTNRNYMLNVSKPGYLFYSENFSLEGIFSVDTPFHKDIPLKEIVVGKSIVLRNVFFKTDDYTLKQESKHELNKVVKLLKENPEIGVEISGHTDNQGTDAYNQLLSVNRAKSVVEYLISQEIKSERLTSKGYGASKAIDSNETDSGRAKNRRTELKIL